MKPFGIGVVLQTSRAIHLSAVAVGIVLLSPTNTVAENSTDLSPQCTLHKTLEGPTRAARLKKFNENFQCIIAELHRLQSAVQIPPGTVFAFALPKCPSGWTEFSEAGGRFIIGVNGSTYKLPYVGGKPEYQLGGEEMHKLTIKEMPTHSHSGITATGSYNAAHLATKDPTNLPQGRGSIGASGSSKPHNNMPPFIALYFCKKE